MKRKIVSALLCLVVLAVFGFGVKSCSDAEKAEDLERLAVRNAIAPTSMNICLAQCVKDLTRHESKQFLGGADASVSPINGLIEHCEAIYQDGCYIGGENAIIQIHGKPDTFSYYEHLGLKRNYEPINTNR